MSYYSDSHVTSSLVDLDAGRLSVASKLGADYTILVKTRDSKELAQQIVSELGSHPDQTIECSGAPPSVATGIYVSHDSSSCIS